MVRALPIMTAPRIGINLANGSRFRDTSRKNSRSTGWQITISHSLLTMALPIRADLVGRIRQLIHGIRIQQQSGSSGTLTLTR